MAKSGYSCCGGKGCCGGPERGLDRRDFLKSAAAGGAGIAGLLASETAHAEPSPALDAWRTTLLERGETRVYRGEELAHIALPLGGTGAGQVFLRGDGTLNPWQNFNNFNSNAMVPDSFFAVRARTASGGPQVRLLQQQSREDAPAVQAIEFSGEYPFAWIRYVDDALPVRVGLEAFSPYIPLNEKDSGLPAAVFRFTVRNVSGETVDAAILAAIPNLIGWDGYARPEPGPTETELGGNVNTFMRIDPAGFIEMTAAPGDTHALSVETRLNTNDSDVGRQMRHCKNAKVFYGRPVPVQKETRAGDVYWVSDIHGRLSPNELAAVLDAVEAGASAVFVCDEFALLHDALNRKKAAATAEIFDDFEGGTYANWTIEGEAFGDAPAAGAHPGQQPVTGQQGTRLVNTFTKGDGPTGKAVSRAFTIEKKFIHFLVGGGEHANETCINLVIDGAVAASERGQNTENLRPVRWDVSEHLGKTAAIEIVDANTGGWGHVLVDDIQFSDAPRLSLTDPVLAERFRNALPFSARGTKAYEGGAQPFKKGSTLFAAVNAEIACAPCWTVRGLKLKDDAQVLLRWKKGAPAAISGPCGAGRIVICNGALEQHAQGNARKAIIGALIAQANDGAYVPQTGMAADSPLAGSMVIAAIADPGVTIQARQQSESFSALFSQFADGQLEPGMSSPSPDGRSWTGGLSAGVSLAPNEERTLTFVLAWYLPNRTRDDTYGWGPQRFQFDHRLGNRYNTWFGSAAGVAGYAIEHQARLLDETRRFHTTFYNSTLPQYFLDAVTANNSLTRSPIYVWLEDGTVGGFEGADRCCPMNCTHVYNYAMSMAYTFPALERNVRETDLLVQMHPEEHYIPHRTVLPLSLPRLGKTIGGPEHPALDGELGTVLKTYREWLMHGDRAWLGKLWDRVRALMLYVMKEHDPEGSGVIKGEQPNTYDTHLYGSNTFIGTLYLAALRAAEEMAKIVGDADAAKTFRLRFEKGRAGYDAVCWNGEYYINVFDAPDANDTTYNSNNCYGPGCFSDQLLGQWWAHVLGLGYVLPQDRVRQALGAIHAYNWRAGLTDHKHAQRVFATGTEKGLLVGSWPKGGRPERPILYCDEVWTGIEYQVAAAMLYEGMTREALDIVRGARDRYTGNQRNPWSEIECGQHYARAMSSYSLLHAAAGFVYDAGAARLAMAPRLMPDNFKAFFTAAQGWGSVSQRRDGRTQRNGIELRYGTLELEELVIDTSHAKSKPARITVDAARQKTRAKATAADGRCTIAFARPIRLTEGDQLGVTLSW